MPARRLLVPLAVLQLSALGCAGPRFQLPMTSEELAGQPATAALVAYLGQPGASPGVCDPAEAPALRDGRDLAPALVDGLLRGPIAPDRWAACAALALAAPGPSRDDLALRILRAELALLTGGRRTVAPEEPWHGGKLHEAAAPLAELAGDDLAAAAALREAYAGRPPNAPVPRAELVSAAASLQARLPAMTGGRRAAAQAFLAALDAERGTWRGQPVDAPALDGLAAAADEAALSTLARRLPDPALRTEAARRLVRLRVARSPFPEVRADAAAVEARVLQLGANPVALAEHPPSAVGLQAGRSPTVLVEQRWAPGPRLLTPGGDASGLVPELPLQGALQAELGGLSRPVTVCAPAAALDPTPCVAVADLRSGSPLGRVDGRGALRLAERLPAGALAGLAETRELVVLVRVGEAEVAASWPLRFGAPGDLVLTGAAGGGRGPDLRVSAIRTPSGRLRLAVDGDRGAFEAVLELADAGRTRVVTAGGAGGAGWPGSSGMDGWSGTSGSSASCPSFPASAGGAGSAGSAGGNGGPGGPGGSGGDVELAVTAPPALRAETLALVQAIVQSEGGRGGAGGSGGRGGRGGAGGAGGSGTSCSDLDGNSWSLSGAWDGPSGPDGPDGADGARGPDGAPGQVRLRPPE
jgi:hypothetical protein